MLKMSTSHGDNSPKVIRHRTLRAVNSVAGLCGFILNTITVAYTTSLRSRAAGVVGGAYAPIIVSIAWNTLEPHALRALPVKYKWATALVDAGLFAGFLTVLIASSICIDAIAYSRWMNQSISILLSYNDMPWIVCA